VPQDAWYKPFLVAAVNAFRFIDGPDKRPSFEGSRGVLKAEFIKMLLVANGINSAETFGEIRDALAADVQNPDEWYYPHMRTAIAYSLAQAAREINPDTGTIIDQVQETAGKMANDARALGGKD